MKKLASNLILLSIEGHSDGPLMSGRNADYV